MQKLRHLWLVIVLAGLLSACGLSGIGGSTIQANLANGVLGFEVEDDGKIMIATSQIQFVNEPGGKEARIVGYEFTVMDDAGYELSPGLQLRTEGPYIVVPSGFACNTAENGCINDGTDWQTAVYETEFYPFILTIAGHVQHILEHDYARLRAVLTIEYTQGSRQVKRVSKEIPITYPVSGQ